MHISIIYVSYIF